MDIPAMPERQRVQRRGPTCLLAASIIPPIPFTITYLFPNRPPLREPPAGAYTCIRSKRGRSAEWARAHFFVGRDSFCRRWAGRSIKGRRLAKRWSAFGGGA